jgi:hypothetical protein
VDVECPREQILAARDPRARGRAAREDDEGVLIAGLGVVDRSVVADRAVPAAVERVPEVGQQSPDPVACQIVGLEQATAVCLGDVGHPGVDPQLARVSRQQGPVVG